MLACERVEEEVGGCSRSAAGGMENNMKRKPGMEKEYKGFEVKKLLPV